METDDEMELESSDAWNDSSYQSDEGVGMEACLFGKEEVMLPEELIEKAEIFNQVVTMETWTDVLTPQQRQDLSKFLPTFQENDEEEKETTLRRLFQGDNFKFGNPLKQFFSLLKEGYLSPNVARYAELCRKAKFKEYKYFQQRYYHRLMQDILISRQKLLDAASGIGPDTPPVVQRPKPQVENESSVECRTSKQYYKVLQECRQECGDLDTSSEDEAFPGNPLGERKKSKDTPSSKPQTETTATPGSPRIVSTFCPKPVAASGLDSSESNAQQSQASQSVPSFTDITEDQFKRMLKLHRKRKAANGDHIELNTMGITLQDVIARTNPNRKIIPPSVAATMMPPTKKKIRDKDKLEKKKKKKLKTASSADQVPGVDGTTDTTVKVESTAEIATAPSTSVAAMDTTVATMTPPAISQVTPKHPCGMYTNFFNLLRETIKCSANSQISLPDLQSKVLGWQKSPMSMLNVWFTLRSNWSELVPTALKWLSGAETPTLGQFSPKVEFKEDVQQWKWIDMSSDADGDLEDLWKRVIPILTGSLTVKEEKTIVTEKRELTNIPSPRMRTEYSVKPSTDEEKKIFREQETRRYEEPHRAFTFKLHGYESVVGPVKGVFGKETSLNKAREHLLLVSDRPAFVTILSLVRDAAARLPNGEGTRADICELLKDSQFISQGVSDSQINTVVSGALDRLHYEKDPCVKYDTHKKLWIYLHRNRAEAEFERIHQEQAEAARAKKALQKPKLTAKVKTPVKALTGKSPPLARPPSVLSEASSDSYVSSNPSMEPQSPCKSPAAATAVAVAAAATSPKGTMASPKLTIGSPKGVITIASTTATSPRGSLTTPVLSPRGSTAGVSLTPPGNVVKGMPTLLTFGVKEAGAAFGGVTVSGRASPKGTLAGRVPVIPGVSMPLTTPSGLPATAVLKTTPISSSSNLPTSGVTVTTTSVITTTVSSVIVPGSVIQQQSTGMSVPTAVTVTTIQRPMAPTGKVITHITGKPLKGHLTQAGVRPTVLQTLGGKPVLVHAAAAGTKPARPTLQPLRMPALGKIQPGTIAAPLGIRITSQGVETITNVTQTQSSTAPQVVQTVSQQAPISISADPAMKLTPATQMISGKPVSLLLSSQQSSIPVSTITSQVIKQGTSTATPATIAFSPTQTVLPATAGLKLAVAQATEAGKGTGQKVTEIVTGAKMTPEQQKPVGVSVISSVGNIDHKKSPVSALPMSLLLSGSHQSGPTNLPKGAVPVIASSMFAGNLPSSLAGKGVILAQVPPGSKFVTAVPASTVSLSGQKSPILVATTAIVTPPAAAAATPSTVVITTQPPVVATTAVAVRSTLTKSTSLEEKKT
ncbi:nuclear factor related to kappa-B-binding protein-like [Ptychodera flava]|uniref:nuclear factor related to kappa-B-binding protein-like n=1 Tax=Ptychodera flava TaxID=63121 RepID=UPI003969F317